VRRVLALSAALALVAGLSTAASLNVRDAQAASSSPTWSAVSPLQVPAGDSISSSMAYDAATGQLVMFGPSVNEGECLPDVTWTWDGANWSGHLLPTAPAGRDSATMAYDGATKQVILFGGGGYDPGCHTVASENLRDTWAWNGSIWVQQHPATVPPNGGCAAYDANTKQFIMVTGSLDFTPGVTVQTWSWTGTTWALLSPASPPPNGDCSMTYDTVRKVIVMILADAADVAGGGQETWTWDGATWSRQADLPSPPLPSSGTIPPITFDADTGTDVTYVGQTSPCIGTGPSHDFTCTESNQTWSWNGSSWSETASPNDPAAGASYINSYDGATHQVVMFGGTYEPTTADSKTWVYASPASSSVTPSRLSGADRQSTAVAVSTSPFPAAGSASAVVLARADVFADALAGGPLAAAKHAPLLLTSSSTLDAMTGAEIQRVLPKGGTVYLLGGTAAISDAVATAITALGDVPQRIAGSDRYSTAVAIAGAMGNPTTVFEASGVNFPDALSAVPAAVANHGAILLTDGTTPAAATSAYLKAHATTRYAIGGPAAYADPSAIGIAGADRYATSDAVALAFFPDTTGVSVASAATFPDALAAGPVAGGASQPVLLVPPSGALPEPVTSYLATHANTITSVHAFGGTTAITDAVLTELSTALLG
jgi:putative cell wall-binding protein